MSERNHRPPPLDPLIEGYLDYLSDVARKCRVRSATSAVRYGE